MAEAAEAQDAGEFQCWAKTGACEGIHLTTAWFQGKDGRTEMCCTKNDNAVVSDSATRYGDCHFFGRARIPTMPGTSQLVVNRSLGTHSVCYSKCSAIPSTR